MSNLLELEGFNTAQAGTTRPGDPNSLVKSGGSGQEGYNPVQIAGMPNVFDAQTEDNVLVALISGSGDYTTPANGVFEVGPPTHQRKFVEENIDNQFQHTGGLHTRIDGREPNVTGLTLTLEGIYLDPEGNPVTVVSGILTNYEVIDGSGDNAAESRYPPTNNPGFYLYRDPTIQHKTMENRVDA